MANVTLACALAALAGTGVSPAAAQDRAAPARPGVGSPPVTTSAPTTRTVAPTEALFDAIARNDLAQVQAAVARGADLSARNSLGMTAIDMAVDRGYFEIGHFLLSTRAAQAQRATGTPAAPNASGQAGAPPATTTGAAPVPSVERQSIAPPAPPPDRPSVSPGPPPGARGANDPFNPQTAPLGARLPVLNEPVAGAAPEQASPSSPGSASPAQPSATSGVQQPRAADAPPSAPAPARQPSRWQRITDWFTPTRKPSEPANVGPSEPAPQAPSNAPGPQSMTETPPLLLASTAGAAVATEAQPLVALPAERRPRDAAPTDGGPRVEAISREPLNQGASPTFMERLRAFLSDGGGHGPAYAADLPVPPPAPAISAASPPPPDATTGVWQPTVMLAADQPDPVDVPTAPAAATEPQPGALISAAPTPAAPVSVAAAAPAQDADPPAASAAVSALDDAIRPPRRPERPLPAVLNAADPFNPSNTPTGANLPILSTDDLERLRAQEAHTVPPSAEPAVAPGEPLVGPGPPVAPSSDMPPARLLRTAEVPPDIQPRPTPVALESPERALPATAQPVSSTFNRIAAARVLVPDGRLEVTVGAVAPPLSGTVFRLGDNMAVGKAPPERAADRRARDPCLHKDQGLVRFCVERVEWPDSIATAFDTASVLYEGRQAVVRYEGDKASFIHILFKADAFDRVVSHFEETYGPATEVLARLIAPLAAPREINPAVIWRAFDPATNIMTTLEVRNLDDARGTFPDTRHGAVLLYRAWARPVFPQLSSVELLLLR